MMKSAPSTVTLSRSEGPVALGVEMLRCAQHDSAILLPRHCHPLALAPTDGVG